MQQMNITPAAAGRNKTRIYKHTLKQKGVAVDKEKNKELKFDNAIVRIHAPQLTEQEQQRRQEDLQKATADFMKAVIRRKGEEK